MADKHDLDRRTFVLGGVTAGALALAGISLSGCLKQDPKAEQGLDENKPDGSKVPDKPEQPDTSGNGETEQPQDPGNGETEQPQDPGYGGHEQAIPKVYFTAAITPQSLVAIYRALDVSLPGKVAVKLSTGEPGGNNYLKPSLIKDLVQLVKGTIVECNTAYGGQRANAKSHYQVAVDHGFTAIAEVDIQDGNGDMALPVKDGTHLKENFVGASFHDYQSYISLAHFKGHAAGGFGGAIKNTSIGIASSKGKSLIHSAGARTSGMGPGTSQDSFLESMAESALSIVDVLGKNIVFINVMNRLSVDCDCFSNPAEPEMADIGILASTDPVAVDQACVDLVYAAPDSKALRERIESRNGRHTLNYGEKIGLGSQQYELVRL